MDLAFLARLFHSASGSHPAAPSAYADRDSSARVCRADRSGVHVCWLQDWSRVSRNQVVTGVM